MMNRSCLWIIAGGVLILLTHSASAQSPAANKPKAPLDNASSGDKTGAKTEADCVAGERRVQEARLLLINF
jgi:hypothetical protein